MKAFAKKLESIGKDLAGKAMREAVTAGANVYKAEMEARAPGSIKGKIIVYERKGEKTYTQGQLDAQISLLVGPRKKDAYYAYFLEHGWMHTGKGSKTGGKWIPPRPFVRPTFDAVNDKAKAAALEVLRDAVKSHA